MQFYYSFPYSKKLLPRPNMFQCQHTPTTTMCLIPESSKLPLFEDSDNSSMFFAHTHHHNPKLLLNPYTAVFIYSRYRLCWVRRNSGRISYEQGILLQCIRNIHQKVYHAPQFLLYQIEIENHFHPILQKF